MIRVKSQLREDIFGVWRVVQILIQKDGARFPSYRMVTSLPALRTPNSMRKEGRGNFFSSSSGLRTGILFGIFMIFMKRSHRC